MAPRRINTLTIIAIAVVAFFLGMFITGGILLLLFGEKGIFGNESLSGAICFFAGIFAAIWAVRRYGKHKRKTETSTSKPSLQKR